jgi:X-X-X-Leu-X-X-Gly heptad repeat protein
MRRAATISLLVGIAKEAKQGELAPLTAGLDQLTAGIDQLTAGIDQLAAAGDDRGGLFCARPCCAATSFSPVMVPGTRGVIVFAR